MAGKKTRTQLQALFKSGAKPSEEDFKDFIGSVINILDDGIDKPSGVDIPLKITAHGAEENLLDFYAGDVNTWRLNQQPTDANPGLNLATGGISKLFIESSSGNVGISTAQPQAKLHIQQSGSQDALRIDDTVSETTPLVVDADGKVGIGIPIPERKLQVEQGEFRLRASHDNPTADLGTFYASNLTLGIGIGADRIAAIGNASDQDIRLLPKGAGKVAIDNSNLELDGGHQIVLTDQNTTNQLKLQLWSGYGLGINNATLFYAADGKHSWRDQNGVNERMLLTTGADGGLTVRGTGNSSFAGSLGIGMPNPGAKLEISGTAGNLLRVGASTGSTANVELAGHVQLREYATQNIAFLQARDDGSNRNIGLRLRTQKAGDSKPSVVESVTISADGNVGIGTTSPGTSKLKIAISDSDFADVKFSGTGMGQLEMIGWNSGWNINTKPDGKHLYLNRDAGSNSNVLIGCATKELFVRGSDGFVGIGKTDPRSALDTGKGVMSGAANDYMKAQFTMSGGGTVTWGGPGGRLKWTQRFIAISMERSSSFSEGHMNIAQPTADIPATNVYDGKARSATGDGVVLKEWEALYAIHTVGGNEGAVSFQIVRYTNNFNAPSNWVLVAVVNDDDKTIKLGTGVILSKNSSSTKGSPIPTGIIMMWSGAVNNLPDGWAICNGQNGTPDLRDRFIVGAGNGYAVNATGGANEVRLTVDQIPSHNHANGNYKFLLQKRSTGEGTTGSIDKTVGEPELLTAEEILAAGGGQAHENRPPYYALAFIMKL